MATTGRDIFLDVLSSEGVTHIFGNPGTTELPLMDALAERDDFHYVLALQEATAVAMADGYAQATGRPAVLNLHTSAGLGNAIGNLTNAQANSTPLVVTAGQQDRRHLVVDPLLAGNLVGLAAPVSKWAEEVNQLSDLGPMLRRAFSDSQSAPTGPVFLSIPMDLLDEAGEVSAPPRSDVDRRTVAGALDLAAELLADPGPDRIAIVAGDEVAASGAIEELVHLAETLGARVHGSPLHSNIVFPTDHPLWAGPLAPAAMAVHATLANYQRVFLVGARAFMVYPYTPGPAVPANVELIHLSPDAHAIGRAHPVRLGLVGDAKATLAALTPLVAQRVDQDAARAALDAARPALESSIEKFDSGAAARYGEVPMAPVAAAHALVRSLPPGATIVDEAITTGTYVRGFHRTSTPGRYFFCRGGGLGWGMPAALGVSLGYGREPVLCVVGDGSAMYSPQALWTAAREDLPVVFAVVNNRQYLILKNNLRQMGGATAKTGTFVGMDIDEPAIDFVALAGSMGVNAMLVEKAGDVADAVRAAYDAGRPTLLELPIAAP